MTGVNTSVSPDSFHTPRRPSTVRMAALAITGLARQRRQLDGDFCQLTQGAVVQAAC